MTRELLFFCAGCLLTLLVGIASRWKWARMVGRGLLFPFSNEHGLSLSRILAAVLIVRLSDVLARQFALLGSINGYAATVLIVVYTLPFADIIGGKLLAQRALEAFGGSLPKLPSSLTAHLSGAAPESVSESHPVTANPAPAAPAPAAAPEASPAPLPSGTPPGECEVPLPEETGKENVDGLRGPQPGPAGGDSPHPRR